MRKRLTIIILLITQFAFFQNAGYADSATSAEYKIKALYLYNFTKFIKWNDDDKSKETFKISIIGPDPFGTILEKTYRNKKVFNLPISLARYKSTENLQKANILFISKDLSEDDIIKIIKFAKENKIITISDYPDFIELGGVIGFVKIKGKVKFEINSIACSATNKTISSKILRLATKIIKFEKIDDKKSTQKVDTLNSNKSKKDRN